MQRDITGRVNLNILFSIFSLEVQAEKTDFWFLKTFFRGDISLQLLNIFATAAIKWEQNISKIMFWFYLL